jgi:hypothetical protein
MGDNINAGLSFIHQKPRVDALRALDTRGACGDRISGRTARMINGPHQGALAARRVPTPQILDLAKNTFDQSRVYIRPIWGLEVRQRGRILDQAAETRKIYLETGLATTEVTVTKEFSRFERTLSLGETPVPFADGSER